MQIRLNRPAGLVVSTQVPLSIPADEAATAGLLNSLSFLAHYPTSPLIFGPSSLFL
jgi:hypothetical protein